MARNPASSAAWGTTLLRLIVGVVFVMHAYYGWSVLGLDRIGGVVTRMGYPAALAPALAWYLVIAHSVGGVLIILGLWTRWAALANVPVMASAVLLLHAKQGFFMRVIEAAPGRNVVGGYEFALTVLVATLALVLLGSGAASIDRRR